MLEMDLSVTQNMFSKIVMDRYVESVEIRKSGGDWDRLIFKNQTLKRAELSTQERHAFERAR